MRRSFVELRHYGIKGMKWGIRNYQNKDGTWTTLGKSRRIEQRKNKAYPSNPNHAISVYHLEKKAFNNPGDVARSGEYWYNQHQEMIANMNVGHVHSRSRKYIPNSAIDYMEGNERQVNRIIYDSQGIMVEQIHGGPHKWRNKKKKDYDQDGAHRHIHDQQGKRIPFSNGDHKQNLTEEERKEYGDLLRRRPSGKQS